MDLSMPSSAASSSSSPNSYVMDDDKDRVELQKKSNDEQVVPGAINILEEFVIIDENDDILQDVIMAGSKGEIEGNQYVVKPKGSFGIDIAHLSPDSLAYLDLNANAGDIASSPQSADSNYSDQISEDMEVEDDDGGDDEPAYILDDDSWIENIFEHDQNPSSSSGPSEITTAQIEINKHKYREFKQFDTVVGHSDHHFVQNSVKQFSQSAQPASKEWIKQIQHEWSILDKDLPDSIYVRTYEERMELLRAVIIGASGTPYQDGLFFFDILFQPDYPHTPPLVHYHSFGHRINPNLYQDGKVCLSLLNTWRGSRANGETWIPCKSTILQVLVSIQALVLNAKPYFNEPGYESFEGRREGDRASRSYSQNVFILSMKSVMHLLRHPPKVHPDSDSHKIWCKMTVFIFGYWTCVMNVDGGKGPLFGMFCQNLSVYASRSLYIESQLLTKDVNCWSPGIIDHSKPSHPPFSRAEMLVAALRFPQSLNHFESFVVGHFVESAPRILEACQAYMAGANMGFLAHGRIQDENGCDKSFRNSLAQLFPQLVIAFTDNGADCQKFFPKPKETRERKLVPKEWN